MSFMQQLTRCLCQSSALRPDFAEQGTSLGRTILGPEENIMSITKDDLEK